MMFHSVRFKSFFMGILVTSVIWFAVMYIYISLYGNNLSSSPKVKLIPRHYKSEEDNEIIHGQSNKIQWIKHPKEIVKDEGSWFRIKKRKKYPSAIVRNGEIGFNNTDLLMLGVIKEPEDQRIKDEG